MFKSLFTIAWRNLLKHRLFSFLNILGLSTGLASALLIWLWVHDEMQMGRFNKKDDQLYQVMLNQATSQGITTGENTPGLLSSALKNEIPEIEYAVSTIHPGGLTNAKGVISNKQKILEATSLFAGKELFDVFSYELLKGDKTKLLTEPDAVVVSDEMAVRLFGDINNAIGKSIDWNISGFSGLYIVRGIFKKPPPNALDQFDLIFSYEQYLAKNPKLLNWRNYDPQTYVIVRNGTNTQILSDKISGFIKQQDQQSKADLFLQKYSDRYLHNQFENGSASGGRIEYVKLFSAIGIFILLIACINFMNLSTARATGRLKEVSIKKVVGAGRTTLALQFLLESLFMASLSLIFAILWVIFLIDPFNELTGKQISLYPDKQLFFSILSVVLITGLIAGSYPSLYISGFRPIPGLKGTTGDSGGGVSIRKALIVFQFTMSAIFIVAVLVVYQQMQYIQTKNLGYNRDNILYFEKGGLVSDNKEDYKPGGRYEKELERLLLDIKNTEGVTSAANFRHDITNRQGGTTSVTWPGKLPGDEINFTDIAAGYGFLETLGIKIKEGRSFSMNFINEKSKIIINEAAVKAMGLSNPVGKVINVWGDDKEIIGVVNNFHFESLYENLKPCFFDFTFNNRASKIMVKLKAGQEKTTITRLEDLYQKYNPGFSFEFRFMDQDYQSVYAAEKIVSVMSEYFAILSIVISCLGLFGLAAFTAEKRKKEIGIRKIIGANLGTLILLLSQDFLKLVMIAVVIAMPVAWILSHQWLAGFAYHISLTPGIFLLSFGLIFFISIVTIAYQTIRAATDNPIKSLRIS